MGILDLVNLKKSWENCSELGNFFETILRDLKKKIKKFVNLKNL